MKIVILTGAGLSAESGLGTFRDKGGVWTKYDLQEVATPEGFARNPAKVIDFYNMRRRNAAGAKPNAAHFALARLQAEYQYEVALITQNVDSLHEAAGSEAIHMHGAHGTARCTSCEARWTAPLVMSLDDTCPECKGARLNLLSRSVKLHTKKGVAISLPDLLKLTPDTLVRSEPAVGEP